MPRKPPLMEQPSLHFAVAEITPSSPFQLGETPSHYRVTRPVTAEELIAFSRDILAERFRRDGLLRNATDTKNFFIVRLSERLQEVFVCAFLDNRHRVIACEELFFGTIDGCSVHIREVMRRALYHNAAAVVFAHNHPSGEPSPSRADEQITTRLRDALAFIDVRVLDHIVVGAGDAVSFAEHGLL